MKAIKKKAPVLDLPKRIDETTQFKNLALYLRAYTFGLPFSAQTLLNIFPSFPEGLFLESFIRRKIPLHVWNLPATKDRDDQILPMIDEALEELQDIVSTFGRDSEWRIRRHDDGQWEVELNT